MTPDEVEHYVSLAGKNGNSERVQKIREFASTDDGKEYVAVNLNKYREKPGTDTVALWIRARPRAKLKGYTRPK